MGRETKILLGLLATLAGVFLGVLSVKLLVPRPPPGTGPDVAFDPSTAPVSELVEPPALSPRVPTPPPVSAAADPGAPLLPDGEPAAPPAGVAIAGSLDTGAVPPRPSARPTGETSLPPSQPPAAGPGSEGGLRHQDPFVRPATLEVVAEPMPPVEAAPRTTPPRVLSAASAPLAEPAVYVARPGDSWWQVAEAAYGDGRLYRALFAWNRVLDPRVSLAPGTRLEVPPRSRLEAAWPKLVPAGR
ncbi:MAG: LysM peptidoglycan-binding domain-containing protein [Planctomycetia bacterium]